MALNLRVAGRSLLHDRSLNAGLLGHIRPARFGLLHDRRTGSPGLIGNRGSYCGRLLLSAVVVNDVASCVVWDVTIG